MLQWGNVFFCQGKRTIDKAAAAGCDVAEAGCPLSARAFLSCPLDSLSTDTGAIARTCLRAAEVWNSRGM